VPAYSLTSLRIGLLSLTFTCACAPVGNDTDGSESETDTTTTGGELPAPCEAYLACRDEATPSSAGEAHAEYGVDGTCWQQQSESNCIDECQTQFTQYGMSYPDLDVCAPAPTDVVLEIGAADFEDPGMLEVEPAFRPLAEGDPLYLVRGGQGLLMLPMGLRGENFEVPEDPNDFTNPKMPILDLWVDIEGYNIGVGGHFSRIANYPIGFVPIEGGVLEHLYTAILVPDELDGDTINELNGLPGHLWVELRTFDNPAVVREIDVVISVDESAG